MTKQYIKYFRIYYKKTSDHHNKNRKTPLWKIEIKVLYFINNNKALCKNSQKRNKYKEILKLMTNNPKNKFNQINANK